MHRAAEIPVPAPHRHLLGIEGLSPDDINHVLDLADGYVEASTGRPRRRSAACYAVARSSIASSRGSTRTRTSFREVAKSKRLGGDVIQTCRCRRGSMVKGESPDRRR
jgi:aspartate carbamoyltransferase catalytic subunit